MQLQGRDDVKGKRNGKKSKAPPNLAASAQPLMSPPIEGLPRRGRKQKELPGLERVTNRAVERAALAYEEAYEESKELAARVAKARDELAQTLRDNGLKSYRFRDGEEELSVVAAMTTTETVKVKRAKVGED